MEKKPRRPAGKRPQSSRNGKNIGFIALIVLFVLVGISALSQPSSLQEIPISQAVQEANDGKYSEIEVHGQQLTITKKGDKEPTLKSTMEEGATTTDEGIDKSKVKVTAKPSTSTTSNVIGFGLSYILPVALIGALLIWMMRSAQGQGNQALSFGKSRARLYGNEKDKINFKSIAGQEEAKQDLVSGQAGVCNRLTLGILLALCSNQLVNLPSQDFKLVLLYAFGINLHGE